MESSFEDSFGFTLSIFEGKEALKKEPNQTLWNPIINAGDERRDKRKHDAGRACYTPTGNVPMKH